MHQIELVGPHLRRLGQCFIGVLGLLLGDCSGGVQLALLLDLLHHFIRSTLPRRRPQVLTGLLQVHHQVCLANPRLPWIKISLPAPSL